jgi:hypothetical protein
MAPLTEEFSLTQSIACEENHGPTVLGQPLGCLRRLVEFPGHKNILTLKSGRQWGREREVHAAPSELSQARSGMRWPIHPRCHQPGPRGDPGAVREFLNTAVSIDLQAHHLRL